MFDLDRIYDVVKIFCNLMAIYWSIYILVTLALRYIRRRR